jgi:hypothetical protein
MADTVIENKSSSASDVELASHNENSTSVTVKKGTKKTVKLGSGVTRVKTKDFDVYAPSGTSIPIIIRDDGIAYDNYLLPGCNCSQTNIPWRYVLIGIIILLAGIAVFKLSRHM